MKCNKILHFEYLPKKFYLKFCKTNLKYQGQLQLRNLILQTKDRRGMDYCFQ